MGWTYRLLNCVTISSKNMRVEHAYRVKASKNGVESRFGSKKTMKWTRSNESQIEWRGRRWDHTKSVFHTHEKQQRRSEDARYGMVLHHTEHILGRPSHEICIIQPTAITQIRG